MRSLDECLRYLQVHRCPLSLSLVRRVVGTRSMPTKSLYRNSPRVEFTSSMFPFFPSCVVISSTPFGSELPSWGIQSGYGTVLTRPTARSRSFALPTAPSLDSAVYVWSYLIDFSRWHPSVLAVVPRCLWFDSLRKQRRFAEQNALCLQARLSHCWEESGLPEWELLHQCDCVFWRLSVMML